MNQSHSKPSTMKQASVAVAHWLAFDLEHIENQLMLGINKAFIHTNQDWLNFQQQCAQRDDFFMHLQAGDAVSVDQYACSFCHKPFSITKPGTLENCHTCSNNTFYQAGRIGGPVYLH